MGRNFRKLFDKKMNRKERRVLIFLLAKLGFTDLPVSKSVTKARQVVNAINGNVNFTTPNPSLASITAAADALEAAEQAMDGTKLNTDLRNTARKTLNKLMTGIQTYVDNVAAGDTAIILSAAMDIRDPFTKVTKLDPPGDLNTSPTKVEGQIKLKFAPVKKKTVYLVQKAPDESGPLNWSFVSESSKATVLINNLIPGKKYFFRVATSNSAGLSGWSDEISGRPI